MTTVISLVGRPGSGKSTVSEYLVSKGFTRFGLGDICREEAKVRGMDQPNRKDLQDIGDDLRTKYGISILSERVWQKVKAAGLDKVVVEGSRHPGDLDYLKKVADRFVSLALVADQKVRYSRIVDRGLAQDPKEWEKFLEFDSRDAADEGNPNGQSTEAVIAASDFKIDANGSKEVVFAHIDAILTKEGII